MKRKIGLFETLAVLVILPVVISFIVLAVAQNWPGIKIHYNREFTATTTERQYQEWINAELGGVTEYRLDDGTRVDILLPERAIEIDFDTKWAEAVGQSWYYSIMTSRPPRVILIQTSPNWKRYSDRVEACGFECWVYSKEREWLKQ